MIEAALIFLVVLSIVLLVLLLRAKRELSELGIALQAHVKGAVTVSGKMDAQQKKAFLEKASLLRQIADLKDQLATSKKSIEIVAQELKRVEGRAEAKEKDFKARIANSLPLNETVQELTAQAAPLIKKMEGVPGRSGPNKREYVYKQMVKDNPEADLRDISVAIEKGIQEVLA